MSLFRLKSEQGKHEFDALVLPSASDIFLQEKSSEDNDNNAFLNYQQKSP